jgi:AmiR/NasT family two-component response regulator
MASPTLAELRQAQGTQFNKLLHGLAEAQATAKAMIKEREAGRALIISLTKKAVERFEMTENVLAKLDGYKAAFDQTISLARGHELIMNEMEDKAEENWKKVRKGSLEKRGEVVENLRGGRRNTRR